MALVTLDGELLKVFERGGHDRRFDALEGQFRLGSHVEGRDANGIKRTVSGLLKLLFPHGEQTKEELRLCLELAMEGRRRVKEQLKKRGSFEFHRTTFTWIDAADGREAVVALPEQGGRGAISPEPVPPGTVYAAFCDDESRVGLVRLEIALSAGTGKLRSTAGMPKGMKESLQRAWALLQSVKERQGLAGLLAQKDVAVEAVDLSGGGADGDCGVGFYVAMVSAIQGRAVLPGTVVLGDVSIQGNIKQVSSIVESLQISLDNGALRALVPIANKSQVAGLPEEVVEKLDLVFFGDTDRAVSKALGG